MERLLDSVPRHSQEEIDAAWRDEGETLDGPSAREIERDLRARRSR